MLREDDFLIWSSPPLLFSDSRGARRCPCSVIVSSVAGAGAPDDTENRETLTWSVTGSVAPSGGLRPTTTEASCVGLDPVVNSIAFHPTSLTVEPPGTFNS
jgi:hypothetical protein